MKTILIYINTVRFLQPIQIIYQIKKRIFKKPIFKKCNLTVPVHLVNILIPELDYNKAFLEKFKVTDIINNEFSFLNQKFTLNLDEWAITKASPLWNFNLQYFEYFIPLGKAALKEPVYYEKIKELYLTWLKKTKKGDCFAWHPYVISLRIVNLLITIQILQPILSTDTEFNKILNQSIYEQYLYLYKMQEFGLLGNHYFENLKTLIITSIFFDNKKLFNKLIKKFLKQLDEQILEDGVHFELSVMYHKIIMEDLLRLTCCPLPPDFQKIIKDKLADMCDALYSLEFGMGKIPLFNDSGENVSKNSVSIYDACKRLLNISPHFKPVYSKAGYYKLWSKDIYVLFDCGPPGPSYIPGHSHCDALSFEISRNQIPLFVNSGTYSYQGNLRHYFRSTMAHNTLLINKKEQSECWGEHRVARRISNIKCTPIHHGYMGEYRNYVGSQHIRKIRFLSDYILEIKDIIHSYIKCDVKNYFHLAPGLHYKQSAKNVFLITDDSDHNICEFHIENHCGCIVHKDDLLSNYAPCFGQLLKKEVLEVTWNSAQGKNTFQIFFL